ncbi:MAG: hypothetical protein AB7S48_06035 [Bacteroidales bacterium]
MENHFNTETKNDTIEIGKEGLSHIYETRKWTMFLSILGFVFIGLMMLAALSILFVGGKGMLYGIGFLGIMLIFIAIYFFPIYYLFKFSELSKEALSSRSSELMSNALMYLKKHYQFMGIFTIVILGIYLLVIIFAVIAGTMF